MSASFYYIELFIEICICSFLILIIGIPMLYLLFWILKKNNIVVPKWIKHCCSICLPIIISVLLGRYIWREPYHDRIYEFDNVKIPVCIISVDYPELNNRGDDVNVVKRFKVRNGGLTPELIDVLETKCKNDSSLWKKEGQQYVYEEYKYANEQHIIVKIDSATNTGMYDYLKW